MKAWKRPLYSSRSFSGASISTKSKEQPQEGVEINTTQVMDISVAQVN